MRLPSVSVSALVPILRATTLEWTRRLAALACSALLTAAASADAAAVEVSTSSLPAGTAGSAYAQALAAANGTEPYAWTLVDGSLPTGMSLDGGGVVSGTSNAAGTSNFVVLVTDAVGDTASRPLSITVAAAPAATVAFEVQPSDVVAGASIAPAVQVKVADAFGNGVGGGAVSRLLVGTGVLTGGGATATDANGIATFGAVSVDLAGSKQLSATSGALTPATSAAFTVSAAAAATVTFEVQPSDVVAGATITPAVQVKVADAFGNGVAGESVSLALVGTGVLTGGGATATDANGVATFSALSVDLAGSKQLSATSGALTPATSASFAVSPAAPSTLAFDVQPSNVVAGVTMSPGVQVRVQDAFGNGVPLEPVTLLLVGSGALSGGGATPTDANGVATFSSLSVDLAGSKQLSASGGPATPATSVSFDVSPAATSTLAFEVQPSDVLAGQVIMPAVQVRARDAFGNDVPSEMVSLSLTGTGTLSGGGATATDGNGVAAFSSLSVDLPGSKQLLASAGSVESDPSTPFSVDCPTITLSPASLGSGTTGAAYSEQLGATGGAGPHTFAITAGALPAGLTLSGAGLLSGTPTVSGQFDFTVRATDASACFGELAYSLIVCGTVAVLPATLPDAQEGAPYSQALSGTGGVAPYAFALTAGELPTGISLNGAGLLSGTPTVTGVFNFTVTATSAGGCAGATPLTLTVPGVPVAAGDLAAVCLTSGNDADGTALMSITFTPSAFTATVEVYRAPFGGYPRFDDASGVPPATPSYPPGAPWVLTGVTASGQTDDPPARDAWSYVVFLKNSVGQVSGVSNKTAPRPNYFLGDVSDGVTAGAGDNQVNDLDVSLLGAHYGISGGDLVTDGVSYLDVGPTVDLAVTSRPFTDARIDFEDLIVFATNYGEVSGPAALVAGADAALREANGAEQVLLRAPSLVEAGDVFEAIVDVKASGRMQGLSAELAWDASGAEPVTTASGGWLEGQQAVVWSPRAGLVDAALLGARTRGISGSGTLARMTFRAKRVGDPALELARVVARDAANRPLGEGALQAGTQAAIPSRTLLLAPWPNPASGPASMAFALAQGGAAELAIFSVDGRRVRTLASGVFEPGTYRYTWAGEDDERRRVAPGVYYVQLVTQGRRYTKTAVHLR